ncbi:MAG: YggS family pyridoxal phosphate-dependent enzyme [Planctomycetota bacterium]
MTESLSSLERFLKNLEQVENRIQQVCEKKHRDRKEITLIAVTKYLNSDQFQFLSASPIQDLGENRIQSLLERIEASQSRIFRWHFIGHLQTNKIAQMPPLQLIHSIDSEKLLHQLDIHYQKKQKIQEVLLQINVTGESSKQGFSPETAFQLLKQSLDLKAVRVLGLMTIAKLSESAEESRGPFRKLKQYLEDWKSLNHPWLNLKYLSMGMSQDFEIAIEEGATHLRLGSVLFQTVFVSE